MKRILFFGPYSPPITGQSMAFRSVVHSYAADEYFLVDTTRFRSRIINSLYAVYRSILLLTGNKGIEVVYFTCTRSNLGAIKDLLLIFLAKRKGLKIINHLHGADFHAFTEDAPTFLKRIINKAYQHVNTSIVLLTSMKREFHNFPKMKLEVIPNFYPNSFSQEISAKGDEITVTYFSHLMESKGIMDFLEAARLLSEERNDIHFKIGGDFMADHLATKKSTEKRVMDFIHDHPLPNVELIGSILPKDRFEFLAHSSIFVLPTYYPSEAFPLTIIEAMRCGNAIITTDHNYLTDIVGNENGAIVEVKNPKQIAEAIIQLTKDITKLSAIQHHNVENATAKYSEEQYLTSVKQVIGV